jgi:hypothetical protein
MKKGILILSTAALIIAASASAYAFWFNKNLPQETPMIGGQKDSGGCLIGAGYSWCEAKQKCLRPWEEKCTATSTLHAYVTYQPMQCREEPWQAWYREGHIQFIKAPTDEELIKAYYGSQNINVISVQKLDSKGATCQACSVCPKSYSFSAAVSPENVAKLKQLGWKE